MFECHLAHLRSVAVLCMFYKICCNPMHPLYGALPGPYVPVWVTRGVLVKHQYTYAPPHCRTSQYRKKYITLSVSLQNDQGDQDLVFHGVGLSGFKSRANAVLLAYLFAPFRSPTVFLLFLFIFRVGIVGHGVFGLIGR